MCLHVYLNVYTEMALAGLFSVTTTYCYGVISVYWDNLHFTQICCAWTIFSYIYFTYTFHEHGLLALLVLTFKKDQNLLRIRTMRNVAGSIMNPVCYFFHNATVHIVAYCLNILSYSVFDSTSMKQNKEKNSFGYGGNSKVRPPFSKLGIRQVDLDYSVQG